MISSQERKLFILSAFWPTAANPITGIFVVEQVRALVEAGYCVTVMVAHTLGRGEPAKLDPDELGLPTCDVELVEFPVVRAPEVASRIPGVLAMNTLLVGAATRRALRFQRKRQQCDWEGGIVHGLRYFGLSSRYWQVTTRAPLALVLHGIDPGITTERVQKQIRHFVRSSENTMAAVSLVGSPLKKFARSIGYTENKLVVVPNGTEMPYRSSFEILRTRRDKDALVIASVSNLIDCKGIDLNLKALAQLYERKPALRWEYRIIGDGPERQHLQTLAQTLGLADRVHFVGRLDRKATMAEIATCDIFCLPSWQEAFGIVYLEAMARCRPVIGCLENGPADFVSNNVDGMLIPPHDIDVLSVALERLLADSGLRARLGQAARETAEKNTWAHNARNMLDLLGLGYSPIGEPAVAKKKAHHKANA